MEATPAGADECHRVGISGHCGYDCPVFMRGECEEADSVEPTESTQNYMMRIARYELERRAK